MSNMRAALLAGCIPGDLGAFKPYAPGRMRHHKVVLDIVEDIGEAIGDAVDWVIEEVIDPVLTTVGNVIESALDNPLKTIAQIAAVATGNVWALPLIEGADVAIKGGDLGDVLEATAKTYLMQQVGSYVGKAAGNLAGEYAGTLEYADDAAKIAGQKLATEIVGSAAGSAAVAVVSGQDPVQAFITGGLGAAVPAVLGKVDGFTSLPPSAQRVIASAVSAQLSGGDVTAAVVTSAISASGIVTDAFKSFDPDGTKLDNAQRAILTDVLMGTVTSAITGGSPSNVIQAAMMRAGSKALGDMATGEFKSVTAEATEAYKTADGKATQMDANVTAQQTVADKYNGVAEELKGRIATQDRLKAEYNNAVAAHNQNPSQATADTANTWIKAYNDYVTQLNKDYAEIYQPKLTQYGGELDTLKKDYATLTGDYEKAIQAFANKTDTLSDALDPIYRTSNRAFVEVMDENFNPEQYRKLNGLDADTDPYEHFLSVGQFKGAPTNNEAAEPIIAAERTRLVTQALESKGVTVATADPAMVSQILNNIDRNYGDNITALKAASIQDVISGNTTSINKLVSDQQNGTFRVEVNGTSYGAWKQPPTDKFTPPAGTKLASFEAFNNGTAALQYTTDGRPVWVESDPSTGVAAWNPATGEYVLPTVYVYGKKPTEQEYLLALAELGEEDVVQGTVSRAVLNAAQTLVGWAQQSGNSTLINTTANILKAGGGFLESINGISVLAGVAPKNTSMGKFANALQDIGKAGNTAEYQAAVANMKSIIGEAKGVGGTLKAIYGAFESAPLQFLAEYVGVEGFQELGPLLIGGAAATGAKGAALALNYGKAVAAKMGTATGMTAAIATDIVESAGGAASSAYDETYKVAIKAGKSPVEADKIAMEVAQRQALVAGATTAVSMGIGGAALEKALLGKTGTGLGDAMQALGDFAKTGTKIAIKEGVSEAGEEGVTQAGLEVQLYKLDPTRDVAKEITQAAAFGMIAGGPIAGGAYAGSRAGDVISNAIQGNAVVANILETNKGNPAAAETALANFGITDNVVKSNLMNTIDNANYTSSAEATNTLAARSDYNFSDTDVAALTGKGTDSTLASRVEAYVDPRVLDIEEVKAAANAEGYTLTDEEAAKLVGQRDEATGVAEIKTQYDPLATTVDEAKQMMRDLGYTNMTDSEALSLAGKIKETDAQKNIAGYVDTRQVTFEEAKKYLVDQGYTNPTNAEVNQFVGQVNDATYQQKQQTAATAYADPRVVDEGEVRAAYEALGLKKPTADDVKKLLGQYDESGLTAKATEYLPTARYNSVMAQLDEMSSGGVSEEALAAIDLVRKDLTKSMADTGLEVAKVALKVDTAKADLEKAIATLGTTTDRNFEAVDKAIQDLSDAGLTVDDVRATVDKIVGSAGTDKTAATGVYAHIDTKLTNLQTQVGKDIKAVETSLLTKIADNEAAGLTRDEATQKAVADLATELGTSKEAILKQIGATETTLGTKIADVQAELVQTEKDILAEVAKNEKAGMTRDAALQKAINTVAAAQKTDTATLTKSVGALGTALGKEIDAVQADLAQTEKDILAEVAKNEAAGLSRDEALQKSIETVAAAQNKSAADILTKLDTTAEGLDTKIAGIQTELAQTERDILAEVAKNEKAGMTRDAALQKAINTVAAAQKTDTATLTSKISGLSTALSKEIDAVQADLAQTEKDILAEVAKNEKAGMTRDAALQKAINTVAAAQKTDTATLTSKLSGVQTLLGKEITAVKNELAQTEKDILAEVAKNEKAGMTRDAALQKAINTVAAAQKTDTATLTSKISGLSTALSKEIADLQTQVGKDIKAVETSLLTKIEANEKAGLTREQATQKAVADLATELGTTKEGLLTQLGTTEANLNTKIADLQTQVGKDIKAVETNLLAKIEANEKAGLTREQATQKAVADLATELGTTKEGLLTQLGTTEANLTAKIAGVSADLQTKYDALTADQKALATQLTNQGIDLNTAIDSVKTALGQSTQQATQSDLDAVINLLQTQGAYDAQYDYNGDRVIDQKDKTALETYLKSTQPGYKPDTEDPFVYNPAAGSKWASSGVYRTIEEQGRATRQSGMDEAEKIRQAQATEAEKIRQAQATEAEKTRQANAAASLKTQRMGNLNSLMGMLGQAGDTGGQQVTVKAADPAKIGYVYDFNSIFANPSQEKMFVSPYAQGGMVDGSDDVNDELLKILKG